MSLIFSVGFFITYKYQKNNFFDIVLKILILVLLVPSAAFFIEQLFSRLANLDTSDFSYFSGATFLLGLVYSAFLFIKYKKWRKNLL